MRGLLRRYRTQRMCSVIVVYNLQAHHQGGVQKRPATDDARAWSVPTVLLADHPVPMYRRRVGLLSSAVLELKRSCLILAFFVAMSRKLCSVVCTRSAPRSLAPRALTRLHSNTPSSDALAAPRVIFSGIQPTGVPHLGNYLGAMQQWVKLQNDASANTSLIYSVVDLHAITVHQNPDALRTSKKEMLAALLAVGLDPQKCTIFFQSDVGPPPVRPCRRALG